MITYVNDVFVTNEDNALYLGKISNLTVEDKSSIANVGKIIIADANGADEALDVEKAKKADKIKIGLITNKISKVIAKDGSMKFTPVVDWTNPISKSSVKNLAILQWQKDTPEKVELNFKGVTDANILDKLKTAGNSIVVRIVYKDMNTRYRKWTESYEYVTKGGEDMQTIAKGLEKLINKDTKRARVTAKYDTDSETLTLTAMEYDDDNSVNSISPAATVRFSVNLWVAFADVAGISTIGSNKRVMLPGLQVTKKAGVIYTASPKYVRDREAAALGYDGIINRGNGTLRETTLPELNVKLDGQYDAITFQFENMYRTADDMHRLTKQSVEIYPKNGGGNDISDVIKAFME